MNFNNLNLNEKLLENLKTLGFETATPVQTQALPIILAGKDIIAEAQTGSGKTVAFGLGILNEIKTNSMFTQGLVLCPTRELAEQVATELRNLCRLIPHVKVLTITGGRSEYQQEKSLEHGAHIIVGTPGRIRRLIKKKTLSFSHLNHFVLDEADRMLDMGFEDDLNYIHSFLPKEKQTLLFSATFPEDIEELGKNILKSDVERVHVEASEKKLITEKFYQVESHKEKLDAVLSLLMKLKPERFIVFCKTKIITDQAADELNKHGIMVESIHSDLDQKDRDLVLNMFSNQSLSGLMATDVAARGIDIKEVDLVINMDIPKNPEVYVHRIGRTGRAGKLGEAISLIVAEQLSLVDEISDLTGNKYSVNDLDMSILSDGSYPTPVNGTLYIYGGKKDKLRPGDIVGALIGEAKLSGDDIGDINLTPKGCYVAIKRNSIDQVKSSLNDNRLKIKKRNFKVIIVL